MARPLRLEYEGALYHVTSRGNAQKSTFLDARDRARFLVIFNDAVNRRHRRSGHVFSGWFKAIFKEKEAYLLELARYILLNPVRTKIVRAAKNWYWSSYRAFTGLVDRPTFLTTDWLLDPFAADRTRARNAYQRFVAQGRGRSLWEDLKGQIYLGSKVFIESLPQKDQRVVEVPKEQRLVNQPNLRDVFVTDRGIEIAATRTGRSPSIWEYTTRRSAAG